MTIRETCFPLFFYFTLHWLFIPQTVISSAARNLFRPLFPTTPSLSRLREAPSPPFLRYGVSRFSLSDTRPLAANEKDPSASLGMTIRETCFPLFFYFTLHWLFIPQTVISSAARNLFRPLFPTTPSLSRLREAPSPPFLRYGVSRFSLSDTRPLAANEKDPSASLGMTIRETCFLNTIFSRSTEMPISRLFTSLSFISRL